MDKDGNLEPEGNSHETLQNNASSKRKKQDVIEENKSDVINGNEANKTDKSKKISRRMTKKRRKKEAKKREKEIKRMKLENEGIKVVEEEKAVNCSELRGIIKNNACKETEKPYLFLTLKRHLNNKKQEGHVKMKDIQDLMLYSLLWQSASMSPKWCQLHKRKMIQKVIVIALKSVGETDYQQNSECFPFINSNFTEHVVQTQASGTEFYLLNPCDSLLNVPVSKNQLRKELKEIKEKVQEDAKSIYLLTTEQMSMNGYPRECYDSKENNISEFRPCVIKEISDEKDKESQVFAIDCEMCLTSEGNELTRVSVLDEEYKVVYDSLVKPDKPILDYKTKYSGITEKLLQDVTVKLQDVQNEIQNILPHNAIVAGHSLEFDLNALKMYHDRIIDTAIMFANRGSHFKPALRHLAHKMLGKDIQNNSDGHCSIEDAKTVMEIVKLKFEKGPLFGRTDKLTEGLFGRMDRERRSDKKLVTAMIDNPSIAKYHSTAGNHCIGKESDSEIVTSAISQIKNCDFVWAHLHGAHQFYQGGERDNVEAKKEVFKTIDDGISQIFGSIPNNCLVMIIMGNGDLNNVIQIQKDPKPRSEELRKMVLEAKKGLCFLKIT